MQLFLFQHTSVNQTQIERPKTIDAVPTCKRESKHSKKIKTSASNARVFTGTEYSQLSLSCVLVAAQTGTHKVLLEAKILNGLFALS